MTAPNRNKMKEIAKGNTIDGTSKYSFPLHLLSQGKRTVTKFL